MKPLCFSNIWAVILTLITFILIAQESGEENVQKKMPAEEKKAAELLEQGDIHAGMGRREEALSKWSEALALAGTSTKPGTEANERMEWANKDEGWGPDKPGLQFARHLCDHSLGTQAAVRQALIREFYEENGNAQNAFAAYGGWLLEILRSDQNLDLLPLALEDGLDQQPVWLSNVLQPYSDFDTLENPQRAIRLMQILGFFEDATKFHACLLGNYQRTTFMEGFFDRIRGWKPKTRDEIKKYLEQRKLHTFGADLVTTLVESDDEEARVSFVRAHLADFARVSASRREEILSLFRLKWSGGYPNTEDMDDAVVAMLRTLHGDEELVTHVLRDRLADLLAPRNLGKDGSDDFGLAETAAGYIRAAARYQPDKARAGLKQALSLLQDSPR